MVVDRPNLARARASDFSIKMGVGGRLMTNSAVGAGSPDYCTKFSGQLARTAGRGITVILDGAKRRRPGLRLLPRSPTFHRPAPRRKTRWSVTRTGVVRVTPRGTTG